MRKIILTLVLIVISFITASAECIVIDDAYMYYDVERFFKVARVCAVNKQQGAIMIFNDVDRGDAVFVPKGTLIDHMKPLPENPLACVVKKGNLLLMALTQDIKCR